MISGNDYAYGYYDNCEDNIIYPSRSESFYRDISYDLKLVNIFWSLFGVFAILGEIYSYPIAFDIF